MTEEQKAEVLASEDRKVEWKRRETDGWFGFLTKFWNFVDDRDIDKHVSAFGILVFMLLETIKITEWAFSFANTWINADDKMDKVVSGVEVAAVIAAVLGPWSVVVGAVVPFVMSFYFKSRTAT